MSRYVVSFLITITLYAVLVGSLIYSAILDKDVKKSKKDCKVVKIKVVKQPKPVVKPKPKPIIKPKPIVKPKPKPIIKPKPVVKPKLKPIIKPKPIVKPKPVVKEEISQEPKIVELEEKIIKQPIQVASQSPKKAHKDTIDIESLKQAYFDRVKSEINKHKIYPKSARRRGIEGSVKVCFVISKDGKFLHIREFEGKKIFKKSVCKAIKRSFPVKPDRVLFEDNYEITLTILYKLVD